jgi:glutathione S-transferase
MMPSTTTFYWASNSCAIATHMVLEHAGADYQGQRIDFAQGEQKSPDYLRINPKGRVPALVTPQGILTETPALMLFVCQLYPQAGLAPLDDPFELARMNAFNSYLCATVHVNHAHRVRGERWSDDPAVVEALKLKVAKNMADCFAYIERDCLQGPWVLGQRMSTCDMYLFTIANWLAGDGVDVAGFPKVADHMKRMAALPAVARVVALHASPA